MGELFRRAVKYLVEGILVAIAAYAIPQRQLKLDEIALIVLVLVLVLTLLVSQVIQWLCKGSIIDL